MMTTINKKMSKIIAFVVICVLAMTMFVGCGNTTSNEKPEITGIGDFDCIINEPVDLLRRVAALDKEDGDITPQMQIDISPAAQINNGVAVFAEEGDYTVTYTVTDSDGNTTTAESYVSVYARDVYKAFDLVDMNGFSVDVGGDATLASQSVIGDGNRSHLLFKITGAQNDADAVLSRTYSLDGGKEYTFKYQIKSNVAGTAKVKVGEADAIDLTVAADDNELTFTHDLTAASEKTDVKVQLMLGGLGNDIDMEFSNAKVTYLAPVEGMDFTMQFVGGDGGNVEARIDNDNGNLPLVGSVTVAEDKSSATLTITTPCEGDNMWRGGMFLKTDIDLVEGRTYNISFDLTSANTGDYEVCILRSQWGPDEFVQTIDNINKNGTNQISLTVPEGKGGKLWLYVRSGTNANTITISDLKVTGGMPETTVTDTYACNNTYKMFAYEGAGCYTKWVNGKLVFEVEHFGNTDWHNKIEGPAFDIGTGSFGDYYISFKAKATAPVQITVIAPVNDGWDPNVVWAQFNLSDTETLYTIRSNAMEFPATHHFEWQFGATVNQQYENVTIEISDLMICYKSFLD